MNEIAKIKEPRQSVTEAMASRYGMTAAYSRLWALMGG